MEELIILIAAGLAIKGIVKRIRNRKRQVKQKQFKQNIPEQRKQIAGQLAKIIQAEQKEKEKLLKEEQKQAEKERLLKFKAGQAYNDISHLEQQKHDILKLYDTAYQTANDINQSDKKRQAAFGRMITIDSKIRSIEKQIENAQFKIKQYERIRNN